LEGSVTRPPVPAGVDEYFFPNNLTLSEAFQAAGKSPSAQARSLGLLYQPALAAQVQVRFMDRRYNLDTDLRRAALVKGPDRRGVIRWDDYLSNAVDQGNLDRSPAPEARFASLDLPFTDARLMASIQKDFLDWAYRSAQIRLQANEALKVYSAPGASSAAFKEQCAQAARQSADAEAEKLGVTYDKKLVALQDKLTKEQRELDQDQDELNQRRIEEYGTYAETVFSLFKGRKRSVSSSLSKRRMSQKTKADVEESRKVIADLQKQIAALQAEKAKALQDVSSRWGQVAAQDHEITINAMKKDIFLDYFGMAWLPYYIVEEAGATSFLPAFG
jgi:hypothetical protein